jgi:HEAT repeat protein
MSLGELGQTDAIALLDALAEDAERIVRLHAIAAVKKFPRTEAGLS